MRIVTVMLGVFLGVSFLPGLVYAAEVKTIADGWQINLGLAERFRQEYKSNFDFNENLADNGNLFYNRALFIVGAKFKDNYEVFLEGLDARVGSQHLNKPAQKDEFDLHQAFIKGKLPGMPALTYKLGKQELTYGKGRLIAAPTWSNLLNSFDAVFVRYELKRYYGDAFSGHRVKYIKRQLNQGNVGERLDGVYLGYRLGDQSPCIETYLLHQFDNNSSGMGRLHRYTTGLRMAGNLPKEFKYDVEVPMQFGDYGVKDIKAYALHADITKTVTGSWKPKVTAEFNMATGDRDTKDNTLTTFVPVYQSTHAPYGIKDVYLL